MAKGKADRRLMAPAKKGEPFGFSYVASHSTDVRKTFERVRAEQSAAQQVKNVTPIIRKR